MNIRLKQITLENFKGCRDMTISFDNVPISTISGANATGKTTIIDSVLWLLFEKDSSGNGKFGIRPVDENGKDIDNLEISVEATFDVDGKEIAFKKIQKQKWTKHRGSSAPTFEGNVNSYEIDGFPQSKAEYQKRINEIIPEDVFRLIADLHYFSNLDWKEKRKLLLSLCGDVTDEDVFADNPEYWQIIKDDVTAAGVEKAREKAKKGLKELNQRQKEIPVRIDEASKGIKEVPDVLEIENRIKLSEITLANTEKAIEACKAGLSDDIEKKIKALETDRNLLVSEANAKVRAVYDSAQKQCHDCEMELLAVTKELMELNAKLDKANIEKVAKEAHLNRLSMEYHSNENPVVITEGEKICPTCGQMFPQSRIDEILKRHEEQERNRKQIVKDCIETGKIVRSELDKIKDYTDGIQTEIEEKNKILNTMNMKFANVKQSANAFPKEANVADIPGYAEVALQIVSLQNKLAESDVKKAEMINLNRQKNDCEIKISGLKRELAQVETIVESNRETEIRIGELQEEQRAIGQKIANAEQKLCLLEEFSMKKSELLSKKITSCFELANFSLFSQQINGGLVEECEITLNGVKYKDMNYGHKIVVAMDIIKAFSNKLAVHAPLFVDNAESVNDFNLPEMPCQLILMKVSDSKKLEIEGGKIE